MGTSDKQFFRVFSGVLAILIVITILVAVIANISSSVVEKEPSQIQISKLKQRIQPVGQVNLASDPVSELNQTLSGAVAAVGETASSDESNASLNGEQAYNTICQSCHNNGLLDSPMLGDAAVWKARLSVGKDALYNSAVNGKGLMPAKGGNASLSEEEVKAAVDYMLSASQ